MNLTIRSGVSFKSIGVDVKGSRLTHGISHNESSDDDISIVA